MLERCFGAAQACLPLHALLSIRLCPTVDWGAQMFLQRVLRSLAVGQPLDVTPADPLPFGLARIHRALQRCAASIALWYCSSWGQFLREGPVYCLT